MENNPYFNNDAIQRISCINNSFYAMQLPAYFYFDIKYKTKVVRYFCVRLDKLTLYGNILMTMMLLEHYGRFVPWTFRTQDDSYPCSTIHTQLFGRFVPKIWVCHTQGRDVSYPMPFFNFLYLIWYFLIQNCKIYPIEYWSILTHFCSFPILDLVFFYMYSIYLPMCDFSIIFY